MDVVVAWSSDEIALPDESMTNTLFILCTSFLVLGVLGLDILLLVIMGSTVVIGLTFIIGFGGSKYLEVRPLPATKQCCDMS